MGFLKKLFGAAKPDMEKALRFLDEAERLSDNPNPLYCMKYIERESPGLQPWIGPDGPLHERFIRMLHKLKSRAFANHSESPSPVERNWDNLPSMLQIPLFEPRIKVQDLISAVKSNGKDLLCLMPAGYPGSPQDARTMIEYTYHFADNPRLAVQFHEWNGHVVVRASFLVEIASKLSSPTLGDLVADTMRIAHDRGLTVETI